MRARNVWPYQQHGISSVRMLGVSINCKLKSALLAGEVENHVFTPVRTYYNNYLGEGGGGEEKIIDYIYILSLQRASCKNKVLLKVTETLYVHKCVFRMWCANGAKAQK